MSIRARFPLFPVAAPLLAVFLATLLAAVLVFADADTGTITGRVLDRSTGQPIALATVVVEEIPLEVTTDSAGYFTIAAVPEGKYTLRVAVQGYRIIIQQGLNVRSNQSLSLRFTLTMSSVKGDTLVLKESPPRVNAQTSAEDRERAERLPVTCVDEVLDLEVGFIKQGDQMHVRGGRSGEVLTILDAAGMKRHTSFNSLGCVAPQTYCPPPGFNTEEYARIYENEFLEVLQWINTR